MHGIIFTRFFVIVAAILVFGSSYALSAMLKVDINGGGGPTLPGWEAFSDTSQFDNDQNNAIGTETYDNPFGNGNAITVTLKANGEPRGRNRNPIAVGNAWTAESDMLRGLIGPRFVGASVDITISGLPEGKYVFVSWHHDNLGQQVDIDSNNTGEATVSDGSGKKLGRITQGVSSHPPASGYGAPQQFINSFSVTTEGGDVTFSYEYTRERASRGPFAINGFALMLLPVDYTPAVTEVEARVAIAMPVSPYDFPFGYPFPPDYPLAGASHPSLSHDYMRRPVGDPKRAAQYALRLIQTDRADQALEYSIGEEHAEHFARHLLNEEMLFMGAMAYAQLGQLDEAATSMQAAIDAGLPAQRFFAGPRRLFAPLHRHQDFVKLWEHYERELVHGPMLGVLTDRGVHVWVRTVAETPVRVALSRSPDMRNPVVSKPVLSRSSADYTAVVPVAGLEPDTTYYYSVLLGSEQHEIRAEHQKFRTYPQQGRSANFQIAFGACAGYTPVNERMWDTIRQFEPLALLQLGDNVYIDDPESPDQQRLMYYQRHSRPEYRRLVGATSNYAIWDDHDFAMDDSEGGPEVDIPYWKPMVLDIFKENWVNPSYGNEDRPGVWFDFQIADVHFIMLDGRYYREDGGRFSDGQGIENASMLGPHQMAWLKQTLTESDATFKVLVSPVPWDYDAKGVGIGRFDGWYGYSDERDEIFSWIDDYALSGVVLLSGDRHRSDAYKISRDEGYDLFEFCSGGFTNVHTHGLIDLALFGYNRKNSFGLVRFNTTVGDPEVTYNIVDIDGEIHHSLTIKLSQLSHR
jgi:alkaline phosphatase D